MAQFHFNMAQVYALMFHTFQTLCVRYGMLKANRIAALPYLPHVPHLISTHSHVGAHTRARTRTHAHKYSSFLVWKVWKVWKYIDLSGSQASTPHGKVWKGMEL
jgi:hypothetical protein